MRSLRVKKALFFLGIILLVLISISSFGLTQKQVVSQNQVLIGKLYEKEPEICKSLMAEMFEKEVTEAELEKGKQALLQMGYTRKGAEYLYLENGLLELHFAAILFQVLLAAGIIGLFLTMDKPRGKEEEQMLADIRQGLKRGKELTISKYSICNKAVVFEISKLLGIISAKEKELKNSQEHTQRFIENIAHQIKTPLACASISMDLLSEQVTEDTQKEYIEQSFRYLKEIEILMKKILDIGRLEAGKLFMKKEAIQMEVLFKDCMMLLNPEGNRFALETEGETEQVFYGDYEWLKEAFSNILKNCMEHDKSKNAVQIKLVQRKEHIFIQIRDHGPGIASEDLEHIFDRFYIPEHAKKSHTGIGLNLAELVIKKHFGVIEAYNHENGGAVFSVLLPSYGLKNEKLTFS